jgi:hypothetical protein
VGTIETHIDLEKDLTIHTVSGEISADDILRKIRSYYEGEVTRLLLWDFSGADLRSVTASDVRGFADLTNSLSAARAGGKTARVVSTTVAYGLSRMFELSTDDSDDRIGDRTFHDRKKALEWLGFPAGDV